MSTITRDTDLLTWLAEQLKLAEPQVLVIEGIVDVFNEMIGDLNGFGHFDPSSYDWSSSLPDMMEELNRFPTQRPCSRAIFDFMKEIYDASSGMYAVSRKRAIKILLKMLDLEEHLVQRKRVAGRLHIISTPLFEQTYRFKVRVRLPVGTTHCRLSKNWGDYFTI